MKYQKCLVLVALGALAMQAQVVTPPRTLQEQFFDEDVIHDIRLEIHPSDWKKLQDNYRDNTYYPVNLLWRGQYAENVAIRSKGRTSRRVNKPGLRVDINRYEDQQFVELKSFLLDNNIQDLSSIKERLAMQLYRKMGIPAPRETHTRLYINNNYIGVYTIVESTDKKFLKKSLGEDDGFLYEYVYLPGYRFQYLGTNPDLYSPLPFKPETNELKPEAGPLEAMVRAVNESSDADFQKAVGKYLDLKKFLTALAVESYLAEYDGILTEGGMNNLYFYRFEKKNLGMFLPKDKDNTFTAPDYPMLRYFKDNVLVRRALAIPELRDFFSGEVMRAAGFCGGEDGWLEREIDREAAIIRPAAYEDTNKECIDTPCTLAQSNRDFEQQIEYMRRLARERRAIVLKELIDNGMTPPAPPPPPADPAN